MMLKPGCLATAASNPGRVDCQAEATQQEAVTAAQEKEHVSITATVRLTSKQKTMIAAPEQKMCCRHSPACGY